MHKMAVRKSQVSAQLGMYRKSAKGAEIVPECMLKSVWLYLQRGETIPRCAPSQVGFASEMALVHVKHCL
jgi:hypothetical protein